MKLILQNETNPASLIKLKTLLIKVRKYNNAKLSEQDKKEFIQIGRTIESLANEVDKWRDARFTERRKKESQIKLLEKEIKELEKSEFDVEDEQERILDEIDVIYSKQGISLKI